MRLKGTSLRADRASVELLLSGEEVTAYVTAPMYRMSSCYLGFNTRTFSANAGI